MDYFIILTILIAIIFGSIQSVIKKQKMSAFNEVLDGDVLSYECQGSGIVIDTKNKTVCTFNKDKKCTYRYDQIREINYSLSEAGAVYNTGTNFSSLVKTAGANSNEQMLANKRSGIFILTDDIKNPSWKINLPLKNKTASSNQEICDRWILIFKKYVL
ncbi:DUF4755 domain-containing protein [Salmonella enterica]|uniref:DUF4755 domain-containing protein n=1 Tax=Salmonella enterica subsp. enterica serovar Pensacola TaxID=34042 RepID=A0A602YXJ4_SALET|nr:DUF4755 domain-containing protein [Salmonella enterica]ECT8495469.1 DUF4755 domain-containing protein [Salmonella enterica subsp. enterica serovar Pensacola]EKO4094220.1 DUF4755 domain-containing protein [Salmonella enterica]